MLRNCGGCQKRKRVYSGTYKSKTIEIIKKSIDWTKVEIFSSSFFILFGIVFVAVSVGFWQLGKNDLAKAYIIPTAVAGVLLLIIGIEVYKNQLLEKIERI